MDAIVAVYSDWGIGAGGTQPIVLKADRKHFVSVTRGKTVIVGRKTLEDFPEGKPLINRRNIVISRRSSGIEGAELARSVEEALALAGEDDCIVLGGASIFNDFFPYLDRVFVTKLYVTPDSDVFFPDLDSDPGWRVTEDSGLMSEDGISYRFVCYERSSKI